MQKWRLINTGPNNGYYNMAIDEAIVIACREGVVPPTLRFYTWDPSCISIGYFQKIDSSLENPFLSSPSSFNRGLKTSGMTIVRRITGGRAVFHGNDLSYSVICQTQNNIFPNNLKGTYNLIADSFICGLRHLDLQPDTVESKISNNSEYQHSTLCFDTSLRHEISFNGRKLIGSAQRRWPDIFLQHGSIIIDEEPGGSGNGDNFISLSRLIEKRVDIQEVITAICTGFREALKINMIEDELTSYEINIAENLFKEKYSIASWNERRYV